MIGIVLAGPTGVGKTSLSLKLAQKLDAVIISADSMQVYKHLDLGTAKIKKEEMNGIVHYMLDMIEPNHKYNTGQYQREVDELLNKFELENKNVILTGGTGLYINSVVNGISALPEANQELRDKLNEVKKEELHQKLKQLDPESAEVIHMNNKKRVIRALEVCILTNKKFSELKKVNIKNNNYTFYKYALERDREILYERINKRVEIMFEEGLLEEARKIFKNYKDGLREIQAIGYKELFLYFENKISLEESKDLIKQNSRRYAKRQFTWFKNDDEYKWFNLDEESEEEIIIKINKNINNYK